MSVFPSVRGEGGEKITCRSAAGLPDWFYCMERAHNVGHARPALNRRTSQRIRQSAPNADLPLPPNTSPFPNYPKDHNPEKLRARLHSMELENEEKPHNNGLLNKPADPLPYPVLVSCT